MVIPFEDISEYKDLLSALSESEGFWRGLAKPVVAVAEKWLASGYGHIGDARFHSRKRRARSFCSGKTVVGKSLPKVILGEVDLWFSTRIWREEIS